jgi:hypothetical protein
VRVDPAMKGWSLNLPAQGGGLDAPGAKPGALKVAAPDATKTLTGYGAPAALEGRLVP